MHTAAHNLLRIGRINNTAYVVIGSSGVEWVNYKCVPNFNYTFEVYPKALDVPMYFSLIKTNTSEIAKRTADNRCERTVDERHDVTTFRVFIVFPTCFLWLILLANLVARPTSFLSSFCFVFETLFRQSFVFCPFYILFPFLSRVL